MAIAQVRDFGRREEKDPLTDALQKVALGLKIAQGVYGFKTASEQSELNALKIQIGQQKKARGERLARLETEGILPASEFDKEYRATTPESVAALKEKFDFPFESISIKVETPEGFKTVEAIPKEDIAQAQKFQLDLKKQEVAAAKVKPEKTPVEITTKKIDQEFAKQFSKYVSEGEEAKTFNEIDKLDLVIDDADKKLSSGFFIRAAGLFPDEARDIITEDNKIIEDRIKEQTQKSLKATLGTQFTEKEGKMILDRAFNPRMPKKENIRRMKALSKTMKALANAKKSAMDYFAEHGTIKGFKAPVVPSLQGVPSPETIVDTNQNQTLMGTTGERPLLPQTPTKQENVDDFTKRYLGE